MRQSVEEGETSGGSCYPAETRLRSRVGFSAPKLGGRPGAACELVTGRAHARSQAASAVRPRSGLVEGSRVSTGSTGSTHGRRR